MQINCQINDRNITCDIEPDLLLIDLVRNFGFKSVKRGCDTSNCGLCTVWIDEKPVLSCSVPAARVNGKKVTTLEGIPEQVTVLAQYIAKEGVEQCGFSASHRAAYANSERPFREIAMGRHKLPKAEFSGSEHGFVGMLHFTVSVSMHS